VTGLVNAATALDSFVLQCLDDTHFLREIVQRHIAVRHPRPPAGTAAPPLGIGTDRPLISGNLGDAD
jgi:hypothetical protein